LLTQRKVPRGPEDEERLIADIIELARQYGRYGYRKIAGTLRDRAGLGRQRQTSWATSSQTISVGEDQSPLP